MNDFERQLANQPLRQPPLEWRAGILAGTAKVVAPSWTWRNWFWPSPIAWGALAAVWVGAFALGGNDGSSSARTESSGSAAVAISIPLYAFAPQRDLPAFLDSLN
jgi:hypothetical protein